MTLVAARPYRPPTPRNIEVVAAVLARGSTKEAAHVLHVSPQTVKNHLSAVYRTLDVETLAQAVWVLRRDLEGMD